MSTSSAVTPGAVQGVADGEPFWVRVPVLSEHSTSMPPSSSTAGRWETTAWRWASWRAPTAIVTDSTAGSATGTDAMVTTSANSSTPSRVAAGQRHRHGQCDQPDGERDQVVPDPQHRRWKWLTVPAVCTSAVVRPKKLAAPVA